MNMILNMLEGRKFFRSFPHVSKYEVHTLTADKQKRLDGGNLALSSFKYLAFPCFFYILSAWLLDLSLRN